MLDLETQISDLTENCLHVLFWEEAKLESIEKTRDGGERE